MPSKTISVNLLFLPKDIAEIEKEFANSINYCMLKITSEEKGTLFTISTDLPNVIAGGCFILGGIVRDIMHRNGYKFQPVVNLPDKEQWT